ncbi:serine arginine-rich splicing factor 4-like isoform x1 protein [Lasius niger]|uniref:Serine arginine-rich splicing factor 4-like isoform x1 protein n=1 Tax=Lasius niger TaxID=67767 RepID=A0A0J7L1Q4_LASNI|nr:serine arginine-rich splicing factor 4-like isoform x1 protein [Lasius niger]
MRLLVMVDSAVSRHALSEAIKMLEDKIEEPKSGIVDKKVSPHSECINIDANMVVILKLKARTTTSELKAKRFQSPERFRTPRRRIQKYHERQRLPYEVVDRRDSPESVQVPEYAMESRPTSIESLTESMDAANNSAPTSSANSSVSNISMKPIALANSLNSARALFRKKSLVQLINNYIKAGIEEGKRQAKKYIRKALSFGVRSGYLIPTDRQGNVLHVCPTLDTGSWSTRRADVELRQRRRVARRGEMRPKTIDDRKAMRRGIPRGKPHHDVDQEQMTRSKRRHLVQSPARRNLSPRESNQRKSPDKSTLRERNKPKTVAKRKSKINDTVNNKRGQQRKRGDDEDVKKPVKRRRMASSSKRAENNQFEPIEESYTNANEGDRNQYKGNEDNCGTITDNERRKSTSSQEDGSRVEKQKTGMSIDDDRENVERKNAADDDDGDDADDDEKSDEASVEHNTNGIREMDA